jgi:YesN/AraC family two-component response regulator
VEILENNVYYSVYIVEDDALIIDSLINSVPWMDNGFRVVGGSVSPQVAIGEILELKPDVVFSDLKMPSMSGTEMIKELKDKDFSAEFVLLSAFGTFDDARNFFLLDGFDYLLKPLQQAEAEFVLERLSRKLSKKNKEVPSVLFSPSNNNNFEDLIQYITENFAKKFTLVMLGRKFNISPNYICNLFSKHYNSTLTIYLTDIRMTEAAKLIAASDKAFKEIAILCGYTDYFYFCKVFKEYFGITPSQYREEHGQ